MRIVREHLESNRIYHLPILILCEFELDEITLFERSPIDGIVTMLLQPWEDIGEVEYRTLWAAHGMIERLQGNGTEVEWQTFERCIGVAVGLGYA